MRLVFILFFCLVELAMAGSFYDKFIDDVASEKKVWRRITSSINQEDSLTRNYTMNCSDMGGDRLYCLYVSDDNQFMIDSIVHEMNGEKSYYELNETFFDEKNQMTYSFMYINGFSYILHLYRHGRIVYIEDGCDTLQALFRDECLADAKWQNAKKDSLGRYVFSQEIYTWDDKGRLVQRVVRDFNNDLRISGTYRLKYGSPCDSVFVDPVDYENTFEGRKSRFNGTFGLIPEMGDPEYEMFAKTPYSDMPRNVADSILIRQQKRCEDYKKSLKKK
ncbi:MAG: hypothetical protein MJY93_06040 [Fibrobacter sp.]|nr:hypothetical protein [Fibrobacter sp.]